MIVLKGGEIIEKGGRSPSTTNNRMEIQAAIEALKTTPEGETVRVITDSSYVEKGATRWLHGWKNSGWKTKVGAPVANQDLWEGLDFELRSRNVQWQLVPGHFGVQGNDRADAIAVAFSKNQTPHLYQGSVDQYPIALEALLDLTPSELSGKKRNKAKAYSYLSWVNGIAERHQTWQECEKRIKGASNAKFKKSLDPQDEAKILANWGVSLKPYR